MTGITVLQGGGAFSLHDQLDARLLQEVNAKRVVVLPTADAFEEPEILVAAAKSWAQRLGIEVEALMVMRRTDAMEQSAADVVRKAQAVWFVGDNPIHLRSVMKGTPVWTSACPEPSRSISTRTLLSFVFRSTRPVRLMLCLHPCWPPRRQREPSCRPWP